MFDRLPRMYAKQWTIELRMMVWIYWLRVILLLLLSALNVMVQSAMEAKYVKTAARALALNR